MLHQMIGKYVIQHVKTEKSILDVLRIEILKLEAILIYGLLYVY